MKILLLGGSGFIGSALLPMLTQSGHSVICTSRNPRTGFHLFDPFNMEHSIAFLSKIQADIAINLSWVTNAPNYLESPENLEALEWSKAFHDLLEFSNIKKVVSLGSSAEYGFDNVTANGFRTPKNGSSLYARCKLRAWNHIQEIAGKLEIEHTWVRVFQAYGSRQSANKLLPTLMQHSIGGRQFELNNPNAILDWIEVSDIARAISFLLEDTSPSEVDLGTAIGTSNLELCLLFQKKLGLKFTITENPPSKIVKCVVDSKAYLIENCPPKISINHYLENLSK